MLERTVKSSVYVVLLYDLLRFFCATLNIQLSNRYNDKPRLTALFKNIICRCTYKSKSERKCTQGIKSFTELISVLMLLISKSVYADGSIGPIYNTSQISVSKGAPSPYLGTEYVLHLKSKASGNYPVDTYAESCIQPQGTIGNNFNSTVNVWGWGNTVISAGREMYYNLTLRNTCAYSINAYIALWNTRNSSVWIGEYIYLPAANSCSVSVGDVELGELFTNTAKSTSLLIRKSGTGRGTVKVSGDDISSGGDLYLGGDKEVIVRPTYGGTNVSYEGGKYIWVSGTNQSDISLNVKVGNNPKIGEHQSFLTARLTCQ